VTEPSSFILLFLESRLVNDIFRGGGSEELRREMLGTGLALAGSDRPKRLISRYKAEKYNMMLEVRKRHGSNGDMFCQIYDQIVIEELGSTLDLFQPDEARDDSGQAFSDQKNFPHHPIRDRKLL